VACRKSRSCSSNRGASDEIDPFASMMLEGYLKNDHPVAAKKNKNGQKGGLKKQLRMQVNREINDAPARG
jgi:hypothetical protein